MIDSLNNNDGAKRLAELYIKTDGDRSWFWECLEDHFDDVYEIAGILAKGIKQNE